MTRVVVDDAGVIAALHAVSKRSEICDPTGQVLGYFVPKSTMPAKYNGFKSPLTAEERERIIREEGPTARPFSEFLEELKKKYPDDFQ